MCLTKNWICLSSHDRLHTIIQNSQVVPPPGPCDRRLPRLSSQLPWKSSAQLVEYYYLWKTADRYLRRRLTKAAAAAGRPARLLLPDCGRGDGTEGWQPAGDQTHAGGPACAGCSGQLTGRGGQGAVGRGSGGVWGDQ